MSSLHHLVCSDEMNPSRYHPYVPSNTRSSSSQPQQLTHISQPGSYRTEQDEPDLYSSESWRDRHDSPPRPRYDHHRETTRREDVRPAMNQQLPITHEEDFMRFEQTAGRSGSYEGPSSQSTTFSREDRRVQSPDYGLPPPVDLPRTMSLAHLSGAPLHDFNRFASRAELTPTYRPLALRSAEVTGETARYLSSTVNHFSMLQNIQTRLDAISESLATLHIEKAATWKGSGETRSVTRMASYRAIYNPRMQAYVKTHHEDPNTKVQTLIPVCLHSEVNHHFLSQGRDWIQSHLPPGYGSRTGAATEAVNAVNGLISEINKYTRLAIQAILLTNVVNNTKKPVKGWKDLPVPTLDQIMILIYEYTVPRDSKIKSQSGILESITPEIRMRQGFLRMQAVQYVQHKSQNDTSDRASFDAIDATLEKLHPESARYKFAFFTLVLEDDLRIFDGKRTYEQLRRITDFALPSHERVLDKVEEMEVRYGPTLGPEEQVFEVAPT